MSTLRSTGWIAALCGLAVCTGCHGPDVQAERFGKVFYLDGAGNWGFGTGDVPAGLRRGGYKGDIEVFNWSRTLNPALDQINSLGVRASAKDLARKVIKYKARYPDNEVNLVGLSGGTGVIAYALEYLSARPQVNNVFMLGSSLSSDFDMTRALASVRGRVYNYHSSKDSVLALLPFGLGTIDRKLGVSAAGAVGFRGRRGTPSKILNIGWEKKWSRLGWNGAHTDYVNRQFIQYEVARKLMRGGPDAERIGPPVPAADTPKTTADGTAVEPSGSTATNSSQ